MTDNELIQLLMADKPYCGNFDTAQLDRVLRPDQRNLLPTMNLRAIAMGFGILVTTSAFASENNIKAPQIDLIEVLKDASPLPYLDLDSEVDTYCHFIVVGSNGEYLSGVKLELLDERGHVADVIKTDKNGQATYNRMMIKEMRILEIRVIPNDSKRYDRTVIPFEGADKTDHQVIRLNRHLSKKEVRKYKRRRNHIRGVMAF